ncbi:MAG: mechanosensitive ion channel family protein [Thermoleophilia bacterium]|nr:mechanosensitive ion channel family protein [Thermoleophilia bacterium]MDH3724394.1 mechanosensitive ion channel family protein [Thermoleophilia bacterium]
MDFEEIISAALVPVAILVVALVLSRVVAVFVRRVESGYLEEDADEASRASRLQRGVDEPEDLARGIQRKRALTLSTLLRNVAIAAIWIVAIILALESAGLPVGPLLAAAGIAGIALGFGAQSLIKDLINGFFILLERQYDVGDTVAFAEVSGTVERIELRSTVLRDMEGRRHVVPNGEIRVSTNYTHIFSRYTVSLPVPYEVDIDRAMDIARDVAEDMRTGSHSQLITEPVNILGVDDYGDSAVCVRLYLETVPGRQWEVGREYRRRLKIALEEAGISMPYPHHEVILRQDGTGLAMP